MQRFSCNQIKSNSCGAAVTMVALHELSVAIPNCTSTPLSEECENFLWDRMKDLQVGLGVTDWQCTPLSVADFLNKLGSLSVAIVHDSKRVTLVLDAWSKHYPELRGFYNDKFATRLAELRSTVQPEIKLKPEIELPGDFDNDARVILLCLIDGGPQPSPLHYLLARKDGNSYWIMNPDGGSDSELSNVAFSNFLAEPPASGVSISGPTNYVYTGIAIKVHKK